MVTEGRGPGFLQNLAFFTVITLDLTSACPHSYRNTLPELASAVSPPGAQPMLYQREEACSLEQLLWVQSPGAPCGMAPGWSVCFLSLFLSMDAIPIPVNFKPTLQVVRAAGASGHAGPSLIPKFLDFPRMALCLLKAYT